MTTIIIDRDTVSMILDSAEHTADRTRPAVDAIADRVECALVESGVSGVEVVREYRTTGRRSTAEGLEQLLERVLVGEVDAIRADVLVDPSEDA